MFAATKISETTRTTPCTTGKSRLKMASTTRRPDPRPGEDRLRDHGPAQELGKLQAEQGDDGDRGVLERVRAENARLGQALGPRRAHVVLPQHLEHARPHEPGQPTEDDGRQAHRRQHEVGQRAGAVDGEPWAGWHPRRRR